MSLKTKLIQCLQDLKEVNYTDRINARKSDAKAENALNFIYQAGLKQTSFTDEEKKSLGALLATAIKPIKVNIEGTACVYRTRLDNSVLMKRSAVQYLIDDFGSFPLENSILTKVLDEANIGVSVKILDKLIDDLCDLSDSDEDSSDRESMGAKKVPSSHTWWSR